MPPPSVKALLPEKALLVTTNVPALRMPPVLRKKVLFVIVNVPLLEMPLS